MRRAILLTALLSLMLTAPALASNERSFAEGPDGTVSFNLPSGNIGCTWVPAWGTGTYRTLHGRAELHCTRVEPEYLVVILDAQSGAPEVIRSGEVSGLPIANILPYGRFWQIEGFTCLAARAGLFCTNGTGAGLRMARGGVVTW